MASPGSLGFAQLTTSPAAPPAGYCIIYSKTDNILYLKDSSGIEVALGSASAITSLTGEATGTGPGATTVTLSNSAVIGKVLTGFVSGPSSTVLATDTILQAIQKLQAQVTTTTGAAVTSLTGDVTGTGPGATATTVAFVGGESAADIATSVTDTQAATAANTSSTIVKRDASGNFSANVITASLTGNASTATTATNFTGSLSGDVTGTQSSTVVATVGGKSASAVSTSVDDTIAATNLNTPSTIVKRNASGNFAAGTITADLTGNVTGNVTGSASNNVLKAGDTMTGALSMGANKITNLDSPTDPNDAANKGYVDLLAVGIIPQTAVLDPDVIDDSLSTPPVSPVISTTYLIGPSPTGAWAAIGAGRLTYWDGTSWRDGLNRAVVVGDRLGIGFEHVGLFGGNFVGQAKKIATVTSATPGSYAYTFETALYRWTTWIDNSSSDSAGDTYYFNGTNWIQIGSGFTADPGNAISIVGSTINVKYDNVGIGVNGSNELELLDHGSTHLPSGSDPITTASAVGLNADSTNTTGTNNSLARSDHTHDLATGTVSTQTPDQTNAEGVSANLARADHVHNIPSGSVVQIGTSNFNGASASFALADHVHAHGNQTSGTLHAAATSSVNGFMSSADKTKLDNATDANTPSTLVLRDASGDFSAGTITATLSGTATNFSGSLSGDVSGTQGATVVDTVGGKTSTEIATSVDDTIAATSSNTPSTIVKRSAAGLTELTTQQLNGSTSGNIQLRAADTTTSYSVKMPNAQGAAGTYLTNDGSGNLTWSSPLVNIDGGRPDSIFVIGANVVGGTP